MLSLPIDLYPKKGMEQLLVTMKIIKNLPANKKYLMPLIQTNNGLYIRRGTMFFTCLKEFKGGSTFLNKCQHFRTITVPPHYLAQLRRKFKSFSLALFDKWRYDRDTTTT